jgi:hypothetical protein
MLIPRAANPRILAGKSQSRPSYRNERANLAGHAIQLLREATEVSQRLQQERHAAAIGVSATG